ncbi:MAG TPA: LysM peptidoglycan-binding domain-containing protein [Thermodesulfobacteriaceae bacterium]|nr:LysM peptidoglycan-binding domain-containing protein [Thermodesulfobacteriaceae bacterium]
MKKPFTKYLFFMALPCLVIGCSTARVGSINSLGVHKAALQSDDSAANASSALTIPESSETEESDNQIAEVDTLFSADENEQNLDPEQSVLDTALEYYQVAQEYWAEGYLDKAVTALDEAYQLILQISPQSDIKYIEQKNDLRFMISKRILEIHASRYTAVNGNHNEIPLAVNKYVEAEIKKFQTSEKRFFLESYHRSGLYRNKIVQAIKEAGLPEELSWLPLIESGFKIKALSKARALGLWQFIPSTGYKFGLSRNTWIDERMDPEKSTQAAIAYLKELHQIFGDWTTVLAAYNCGEGRVLRVIKGQKINYLDNFWDLYEKLPRETARYVPRFLATLHIIKNPAKYGIELVRPAQPVPVDVVPIEKQVHLKTVAKTLGISYTDLVRLNPALRYKITPGDPYELKVPKGHGTILQAKLGNIPRWSPPKRVYVYHKVRKGESLSIIASRYNTRVRDIILANNIRKKHFIRAGQRLKIPLKKGASRRAVRCDVTLSPSGKYTVRKGDSLWRIARKFNITTKDLIRLNKLSSTRLHVGQVLTITKGKCVVSPDIT